MTAGSTDENAFASLPNVNYINGFVFAIREIVMYIFVNDSVPLVVYALMCCDHI